MYFNVEPSKGEPNAFVSMKLEEFPLHYTNNLLMNFQMVYGMLKRDISFPMNIHRCERSMFDLPK